MVTSTVASTGALAATALRAGPAVLAGPESDKAGPLGLLTIVLLGIAVYFLYRSMVRHIKKVPASFDPPAERGRGGPAVPRASPAAGATPGPAAAGDSPGSGKAAGGGTRGAAGPAAPGDAAGAGRGEPE